MMASIEQEKPARKPYSKPELRVVQLATKEVLAVGCKNVSGMAALSPFPPCWSNNCLQDGS